MADNHLDLVQKQTTWGIFVKLCQWTTILTAILLILLAIFLA